MTWSGYAPPYLFSDVEDRPPLRNRLIVWNARSVWLAVLVVAAPTPAWTAGPMHEATVVHVDDGDTIDVRVDGRIERVRYIGIDAPELARGGEGGAPGGEAAKWLNVALVGGRRIRLELDREVRDRYGRLLAYVWVGGAMVNLEMVRRGYARALAIPPNVRHARWFAVAEAAARASRAGLWSRARLEDPATPSPATRNRSMPCPRC